MTSINSKALLLLAFLMWLVAVGWGMSLVWAYEHAPGHSGTPPANWPTESSLGRKLGQPTLVLFIHPHCPCSRATIDELAILMAHSQGAVNAQAVFVKPTGATDGWEKTDLWSSANNIPGVNVSVDENGVEARRFESETSGQAALYSVAGRLIFSGGITSARGHAGDNDGRSAIQSLLLTGKAVKTQTAVFGCPFVANHSRKRAEDFCDESHGK